MIKPKAPFNHISCLSIYNPKYEVKLSESTNTMFPNYQAPDSIIVIQQQQQQANNANTDLKRRNSVRSVNNKHDKPDGEENKKKSGALRDFFTSTV